MIGLILNQTMVMLLLILLGLLCKKIGMLSERGTEELSALVLQVVNPVVILMAYQRDLEVRLVRNLAWAFALSVIAYAVMIGLSMALLRPGKGRETAVERVSSVYSNCGFMGIPLIQAVLGSEGVFYLTAFLTMFNLLVWTHGVMVLSGERSARSLGKMFRSPAVIAIGVGLVLFFAQIRLPGVLHTALTHVGSVNTPLAMIVAGATIARTDLRAALRKGRIYLVCLLTLVAYPVALILLFHWLPAEGIVKQTVVLAVAAPTAITCTLQCIKYRKNALFAAEIFSFTTLLSILTLPLIGSLLTFA